MILFADFEPREVSSGGFFKVAEHESLGKVLQDVNDWIEKENIDVVNIETVVLPNIHNTGEEGTTDPSIRTSGEMSAYWYQFFRVWYRK
ncbi:MAG: hypothetical protein EP343_12270 [Deltaproteobacteria bacterium]|nr:MAG: hypothetical protein EP343_12270 [Deltaproteobacteria bacterium]